MDGIQAAILLAKLPYLPEWTHKRQTLAQIYTQALSQLPAVKAPHVSAEREHVYHLYVICLEERDSLKHYLSEKGIVTSINYPRALPFYPAYAYLKHQTEDFPQAAICQKQILSLPLYPELTHAQLEYVLTSIRNYFL